MSIPTPDDMLYAAGALRDEADALDMALKATHAPNSVGAQHFVNRRDALRRAADYLDQQAQALQAVAA